MKSKPTLLILFLVVFLDLIGFGIIIPLLPYYSEKLGASGWILGAAFSSYSLMQFLFAPLWGKLSDQIGRRPVVLISLLGSVAAYLLFAYANTILVLIGSRILAGICGANFSVASAYVADITTRENRSKGMGLLGAAFGLGFLAGPLLGGSVASMGHQAPAFAASILSALAFVLALFALPESLNPAQASEAAATARGYFNGWWYVLNKPAVRTVIVIGFLFNLAITQWETTFALFLQRDPIFHVKLQRFFWLLAYIGFLVTVIQGGLIGRLSKRFGETRLLQCGLFSLVLSLSWMPFTRTISELVINLTILGIAMGLTRPVMSGSISLLAEPAEQGLVMGVFLGVGSLSRIFGPMIGGVLIDTKLSLPFLVAATFGGIALYMTTQIREKKT